MTPNKAREIAGDFTGGKEFSGDSPACAGEQNFLGGEAVVCAQEPVAWMLTNSRRYQRSLSWSAPSAESLEIAAIENEVWMPLYPASALASLAEENKRLREDAERYRFVRDLAFETDGRRSDVLESFGRNPATPDAMDAAIDAARAALKEPQ